MLEKLKKALKELKDLKDFKNFKKENSNAYLASCIVIIDGKNIGDWQVDYYQPVKHKMTTFTLKDKIELKGEDNIFQKEKVEIKELKLSEVKTGLDKMLKIVEDLRKKKYPGDFSNKVIAVLQNQDGKVIWNVTNLTSTLKVWNVKIDAKSGKIISEKMENVFSFKAS